MRNLLIWILDLKMSDKAKWQSMFYFLVALVVTIIGYDVWVHFHQMKEPMLIVTPISLLIFAGMIQFVLRHDYPRR